MELEGPAAGLGARDPKALIREEGGLLTAILINPLRPGLSGVGTLPA